MASVEEVILTLPYFGNIDHYAQLLSTDAWIDVHEHYQKQSCRNRMYLCDAQGRFSLTAPVLHKSGEKETLKEIRLSAKEDWQSNHWKAIKSAYGASPFLMYYEMELKTFFSQDFELLIDLNQAAHEMICGFLKCPIPLRFSESYIESTFGEDHRWRYKHHFPECETYIQVFTDRQPFFPGLSVLDLILCIGPEALPYLINHTFSS
jgi:hypothetical protein